MQYLHSRAKSSPAHQPCVTAGRRWSPTCPHRAGEGRMQHTGLDILLIAVLGAFLTAQSDPPGTRAAMPFGRRQTEPQWSPDRPLLPVMGRNAPTRSLPFSPKDISQVRRLEPVAGARTQQRTRNPNPAFRLSGETNLQLLSARQRPSPLPPRAANNRRSPKNAKGTPINRRPIAVATADPQSSDAGRRQPNAPLPKVVQQWSAPPITRQ